MTTMLAQVREILPKYRSGPLPKVFKVLPKFEAWEEVSHFPCDEATIYAGLWTSQV